MMKMLAAIVLAAGKGTRMKSGLPKVLHEVADRPMLAHVLSVLKKIRAGRSIVVVGHEAGLVKKAFCGERVEFVEQRPQLGTGHAVMTAARGLRGFRGEVLILSGDVPLITEATIRALIKVHRGRGQKAAVSLVTTILDDPSGYGRVLRDEKGAVTGIVEHRDASAAERRIGEINAGIYLMDSGFLLSNIKRLKSENAQGEYYLPDLVRMAVDKGLRVSALTHMTPDEVMGINNRSELARAGRVMRMRILEGLMMSGVTVVDPEATYIGAEVKVGRDSTIYPSVHIEGKTSIGRGVVIEEGVRIKDSAIGDGSVVKSHSVIEESRTGRGVTVGPIARLRPGTVLSDGARIGNFVEVKKSRIGRGSKVNHLSYIGDAVVGSDVNIGAGTITCNYDGLRKYVTRIGDGAFIGSDTQLVAPVRIGRNAYVGSGTTVTKDVPAGALVITRAEEKVVPGWVKKKGLLDRKKN